MTAAPAPGDTQVSTTLDQLAALKRRARARARGGWWAPAIFGLLTLASIVLYRPWFTVGVPSDGGLFFSYSAFAGLPGNERSRALSIAFWVVLAPLAYLASAYAYRRHAERRGVSLRWRPWAWTGFGLFALLMATIVSPPMYGPAGLVLFRAGVLTPLLPIGLGLLVLAVVERSVPIGASAVLYTFLVVSLDRFDPTEPIPGLALWDWLLAAPGQKLVLLSAVLFAGAGLDAAFSARARRRARA
jgi:hypothetical protein